MARPSDFTDEIANEICMRLIEGQSLAQICRDDAMPAMRTVYGWIWRNEQFAQDYTRARREQGHTDADAVHDIGGQAARGEMDPQSARVAIDAYKWTAGRRLPKVYGDKLEIAGDKEAPLTVEIVRLGSE